MEKIPVDTSTATRKRFSPPTMTGAIKKDELIGTDLLITKMDAVMGEKGPAYIVAFCDPDNAATVGKFVVDQKSPLGEQLAMGMLSIPEGFLCRIKKESGKSGRSYWCLESDEG